MLSDRLWSYVDEDNKVQGFSPLLYIKPDKYSFFYFCDRHFQIRIGSYAIWKAEQVNSPAVQKMRTNDRQCVWETIQSEEYRKWIQQLWKGIGNRKWKPKRQPGWRDQGPTQPTNRSLVTAARGKRASLALSLFQSLSSTTVVLGTPERNKTLKSLNFRE